MPSGLAIVKGKLERHNQEGTKVIPKLPSAYEAQSTNANEIWVKQCN